MSYGRGRYGRGRYGRKDEQPKDERVFLGIMQRFPHGRIWLGKYFQILIKAISDEFKKIRDYLFSLTRKPNNLFMQELRGGEISLPYIERKLNEKGFAVKLFYCSGEEKYREYENQSTNFGEGVFSFPKISKNENTIFGRMFSGLRYFGFGFLEDKEIKSLTTFSEYPPSTFGEGFFSEILVDKKEPPAISFFGEKIKNDPFDFLYGMEFNGGKIDYICANATDTAEEIRIFNATQRNNYGRRFFFFIGGEGEFLQPLIIDKSRYSEFRRLVLELKQLSAFAIVNLIVKDL
jgi:hypothetical protein